MPSPPRSSWAKTNSRLEQNSIDAAKDIPREPTNFFLSLPFKENSLAHNLPSRLKWVAKAYVDLLILEETCRRPPGRSSR